MKIFKSFLLALVLGAGSFLAAENPNLIINGNFEGKGGWWVDYRKGTWKTSLHTEDASWNKCVRMELAGFLKNRKGTRAVGGALHVGKNGRFVGVPVKPNTEYEVTFSLKSSFKRAVGVQAVSWDKLTQQQWDKSRKRLKTSVGGFAGTPDNWKRCRTTFRTGNNAKTAAVVFNMWGDESQQKNFSFELGQYYMIDNVEMREISSISSLLDAPAAAAPAVNAAGKKAVTLPAAFIVDKRYKKYDQKLPGSVSVKMSDAGDALLIQAECKVIGKLRDGNSRNGDLWSSGDVLEFFFGNQQFAIGAGGGRYNRVDQWQGKVVAKNDRSWSVEVRFPYALIGEKSLIKFNIARSDTRNSTVTLAPVQNGFNDEKHFLSMVFPEYKKVVDKEFAQVPKEVSAQAAALKKLDLASLPAAAEALRAAVRNVRLGKAKFLLSRRNTTSDCAEPLIIYPENLVNADDTISVQAVRNEIAPLVLAVTNRTNRTERYQITVHKNGKKNTFDQPGLGENAPKVTVHEAIVVKDSDSKNPSRRYDALVELNSGSVITIGAKESALLWITFDCRNAQAGEHKGFLRVTPLSEPATLNHRKYTGSLQDYPLSVKVLDVKLPYIGDICLLSRDINDSFFKFNMDMNAGSLIVSPFQFRFGFDEKGFRIKKYIDLPQIAARVKEIREKYPHIKTKFFIGYSTFLISTTRINKLDIFTERGKRAWQEQIRGIAESMKRAGVRYDEYVIELFDEPLLRDMKRDLEATKLAYEADPNIRFSMTWCTDRGGDPNGQRHKPPHIRQFDPYLKEHMFWHGLPKRDDFQQMIKEFKANGKACGFYACSTSMQLSLYSYFRMHAWQAFNLNVTDPIMFYNLVDCGWGVSGAASWKRAASGAIVYRYGDKCLSSVRAEVLRQGFDDMRYMQLLRQTPEGKKIADEYMKKAALNYNAENVAREFRQKAWEFLSKK